MAKRTIAAALAILLLLVCAGCGAKDGGAQNTPAPAASPAVTEATPVPSAKPETTPAPPAATGTPSPEPEDDVTGVSSVEELVEAIRPQARIRIKPGRYNLSEYLSAFPNARDYEAWNAAHDYVQILDAYDGLELLIKDVTELSIEGGSDDPADTELVTESRYAAVLNFSGCTGIELRSLTMGHTEGADCSGDVLCFNDTKSIFLHAVDLYGCGVCGIGCNEFSGNLYVTYSTIRDCEYGPFEIYDGEGDFEFIACTLSGSGGGGYYEANETSQLSFTACSFGQEESNVWYFREDVTIEDCDFMEPTQYPDFEYDAGNIPDFDPETMTEIEFDESRLEETDWVGYAAVNPESGETTYLAASGADVSEGDYAFLTLEANGMGWLDYRFETMDFDWYCMAPGLACLESGDRNLYVSLYENAHGVPWLLMEYDGELIWFY
jgi:hypothetical protein